MADVPGWQRTPVHLWSSSDVSQFLWAQGLGDLSPILAKHDINGSVLAYLSEAEMESHLGITKFGHRRRLHMGIQNFLMSNLATAAQAALPNSGSQVVLPNSGSQAALPNSGLQAALHNSGSQAAPLKSGSPAALPNSGSQAGLVTAVDGSSSSLAKVSSGMYPRSTSPNRMQYTARDFSGQPQPLRSIPQPQSSQSIPPLVIRVGMAPQAHGIQLRSQDSRPANPLPGMYSPPPTTQCSPPTAMQQRTFSPHPATQQRTYSPPPATRQRTANPSPTAPSRTGYSPPPATQQRTYSPPPATRQRAYSPPPATQQRTYSPPPAASPTMQQRTFSPPPATQQRTFSPPPATQQRTCSPSPPAATRQGTYSPPPATRQRAYSPPPVTQQRTCSPPPAMQQRTHSPGTMTSAPQVPAPPPWCYHSNVVRPEQTPFQLVPALSSQLPSSQLPALSPLLPAPSPRSAHPRVCVGYSHSAGDSLVSSLQSRHELSSSPGRDIPSDALPRQKFEMGTNSPSLTITNHHHSTATAVKADVATRRSLLELAGIAVPQITSDIKGTGAPSDECNAPVVVVVVAGAPTQESSLELDKSARAEIDLDAISAGAERDVLMEYSMDGSPTAWGCQLRRNMPAVGVGTDVLTRSSLLVTPELTPEQILPGLMDTNAATGADSQLVIQGVKSSHIKTTRADSGSVLIDCGMADFKNDSSEGAWYQNPAGKRSSPAAAALVSKRESRDEENDGRRRNSPKEVRYQHPEAQGLLAIEGGSDLGRASVEDVDCSPDAIQSTWLDGRSPVPASEELKSIHEELYKWSAELKSIQMHAKGETNAHEIASSPKCIQDMKVEGAYEDDSLAGLASATAAMITSRMTSTSSEAKEGQPEFGSYRLYPGESEAYKESPARQPDSFTRKEPERYRIYTDSHRGSSEDVQTVQMTPQSSRQLGATNKRVEQSEKFSGEDAARSSLEFSQRCSFFRDWAANICQTPETDIGWVHESRATPVSDEQKKFPVEDVFPRSDEHTSAESKGREVRQGLLYEFRTSPRTSPRTSVESKGIEDAEDSSMRPALHVLKDSTHEDMETFSEKNTKAPSPKELPSGSQGSLGNLYDSMDWDNVPTIQRKPKNPRELKDSTEDSMIYGC